MLHMSHILLVAATNAIPLNRGDYNEMRLLFVSLGISLGLDIYLSIYDILSVETP
jgi:hypothetical protein